MCAWQLATTVSLLLSPTLISLYIPGIVFLALRAVLIEQLFPQNFPLFFFPRKTGKARKTGNISKVWKFNRGQNTWKASHSNIWKKKKRKNMEMQNITRTKKSGNLVKTSFDKNGPTLDALICGATQTISMRVSKTGLLLVWTDKGADCIPSNQLSTKYIACELYLRQSRLWSPDHSLATCYELVLGNQPRHFFSIPFLLPATMQPFAIIAQWGHHYHFQRSLTHAVEWQVSILLVIVLDIVKPLPRHVELSTAKK